MPKWEKLFFNLYRKEYCKQAFILLDAVRVNLSDKDKFKLVDEDNTEEIKYLNIQLKKGLINNFIYLLIINYYASRTYNDLNQYPVFPWLFFDIKHIGSLLNAESNNIVETEI